MPNKLTAATLRLPLIQNSRDKIVNKLGGKNSGIPRGNAVSFLCAIFLADPAASSLVDDLSNIAAVTMQARRENELGTALFDKTIAIEDFDNVGLTWENWNANASQHFTISLTAEETGQNLEGKNEIKVYIAFEAVQIEGDPIFLGSISTVIFEDGIGSSGAPVVGDPSYLTAEETAAIYGRRGVTVPDYRSDLTGLDGESATDLDSIATVGLAAGYWIAFEVAGQGIKNFKLRAGTAVQALPGVVLPADYNAASNAKYWETV